MIMIMDEKLRLRVAKLESQHTLVHNGLFTVKTANEWLQQAALIPNPIKLFGPLWFEHELAILFAGTNNGKSVLAMQICDSITRAIPILNFPFENVAQKVLYFDFELHCKQFENRYSAGYTDHFKFSSLLFRAELDLKEVDGVNFEQAVCEEIVRTVLKYNIKVIVIDNLSYLNSDTEKAKEAGPLLRKLNQLKKEHSLSILCIAHTPKRNKTKLITENDIFGSSMIANFVDSAIAIGESLREGGVHYIKQVKSRYTEKIYGQKNVILCRLSKSFNFLQFEFIGYGQEDDHLRIPMPENKEVREKLINELKGNDLSNREIGARLGIDEKTVRNNLKQKIPNRPSVISTEQSNERSCPF